MLVDTRQVAARYFADDVERTLGLEAELLTECPELLQAILWAVARVYSLDWSKGLGLESGVRSRVVRSTDSESEEAQL